MCHRTDLRALVVSAMMTALAVTLPAAFHLVGLGSTFLPLLLPITVNAFLVPTRWAVATGIIAPLASMLATGMPPLYPPIALVMAAEGAVISAVAATLFRLTRRRRLLLPLVAGIVSGRCTMLLLTGILAGHFGLPAAFSAGASLLHGMPGVVLQIVLVPIVVKSLAERRRLLFLEEGAR